MHTYIHTYIHTQYTIHNTQQQGVTVLNKYLDSRTVLDVSDTFMSLEFKGKVSCGFIFDSLKHMNHLDEILQKVNVHTYIHTYIYTYIYESQV